MGPMTSAPHSPEPADQGPTVRPDNLIATASEAALLTYGAMYKRNPDEPVPALEIWRYPDAPQVLRELCPTAWQGRFVARIAPALAGALIGGEEGAGPLGEWLDRLDEMTGDDDTESMRLTSTATGADGLAIVLTAVHRSGADGSVDAAVTTFADRTAGGDVEPDPVDPGLLP